MNMSRYATQQLELTVRKALRMVAEDDARARKSNRIRKIPAQDFGTAKHRLCFKMGD